jgi:putative membrane protein
MSRSHAWVAGAAALSLAALGCGAAFAQSAAESNPGAVPRTTGAPPDAAEPSAATAGTAGNEATGRVDRSATQQFISQATASNLAEIAEARYALSYSQSAEVKQFAQTMIADHTRANDQLDMIAMAHGYATTVAQSRQDELSLHKLMQAHGKRFDADYSKAQASDHREVISLFRRAAQNPNIAPQVRRFAQMALPTLQDHLNMANQLVATEAGDNHSAG